MEVNLHEAKTHVIECIKNKLVPFLHSSPGIGKSSIIKEIADEHNLEFIDIRLSQMESVDLLGYPKITGSKASYIPMDLFPLEGDSLPKGKKGYLCFFDEFSSASMPVQAASYRILLDREVGNHKLHPRTALVCAGNLATDNAIVNRISTALQSRVIHFLVKSNKDIWAKWASKNNIDFRIIAFIQFRPDLLNHFNPDHNDFTFPCERTWDFASRFIVGHEELTDSHLARLAGTISEGTAREFVGFTKIYKELPSFEDIISNPTEIKIPREPSHLFALSGSLANYTDLDNIESVMQFVNRIHTEFQVITLQSMIHKNSALISTESVRNWINTTGKDLI